MPVLRPYSSGPHDPTVVATWGEPGYVYSRIGALGIQIFQKQDTGLTTNWTQLGGSVNINLAAYGECLDEQDAYQAAIDAKKVAPANYIENTGGTPALQALINGALNGEVIEIQHNGAYGAITIPGGKGITIRAGTGFLPVFTAANAVTFQDNAQNIFLLGLKFLNCTTADANGRGSALCMNQSAKVTNIYVSNCQFERCSGSSILLAYHQSIGPDNYAAAYNVAELSTGFYVFDSRFLRACSDITEGASLCSRGFDGFIVRRCNIDAGNGSDPSWANEGQTRGVLIFSSKNVKVQNTLTKNAAYNTNSTGEGFKFDNLAAPVGFTCDASVEKCFSFNNRKGFVCDDDYAVQFVDCVATNCVAAGINFRKATSSGGIYRCSSINNQYGVQVEAAVPALAVQLSCNLSMQNTTQDYFMQNNGAVGINNLRGARGSLTEYLNNLPPVSLSNQAAPVITLAAGFTLTPVGNYMRVNTGGAAVTSSAVTAIKDPLPAIVGQLLAIENTDAAFGITIKNNANTKCPGAADLTINPRSIATFIFNGTDWVTQSVSVN